MGLHMIQKCALADALRGAFEEEVGGLYLHEEMNQADADGVVVNIVPEPSEDANEALQQTASATIEQRPAPRQITPATNQQTTAPTSDQETSPTIAELKTMLQQAELLNDTGAFMTWKDFIALAFEKDIQKGRTVEQIMEMGNRGRLKLSNRQYLLHIIESLKAAQNGEIRKRSPSTE
jgi:hypothetical protein